MPNRSITGAPPVEGWAEVRAHDQVMRYRRVGAGRAVLVLAPSHGAHALPPDVVHALAARFRLILPEVPDGSHSTDWVVGWLADFLDGLGTTGVAVIAAGAFCAPAVELARRDADQVARVVLVPGSPGAGAGRAAGPLAERPHAAGPSLQLLDGEPSAVGLALPRIVGFLGGDGAAAA
jgi:hypothetical protein